MVHWNLVYREEYEDKTSAIKRELAIKRMKSRKYIENLVKRNRIGYRVPIEDRKGPGIIPPSRYKEFSVKAGALFLILICPVKYIFHLFIRCFNIFSMC